MAEKILLTDDEPGIRKILGLTLTDMGYRVFTAENGREALGVFEKERPPVVFTDIKMPGIDGIELLRQIKQIDPDTEVIMISGHGDMDLAIESLKLEACDFITKPINNDALEIALKRAWEKIGMRRQIREYTENLETMVQEKSARLIEIERMVAVDQAVEGLSTALNSIAGGLNGDGIRYFNEMPCFVAIHSASHKIVAINQLYADRIGNRVGSGSGEVYQCSESDPTTCPVAKTFQTGNGQKSREVIKYRDNQEGTVLVHTAPIRDSDGRVELVVEISVDVTEIRRLQDELEAVQQRYRTLFDAVPCYISVQDRDFHITAANQEFKSHFDVTQNSRCYKVYRDRMDPCSNCPTTRTFADGRSHQAEMVVTSKTGEQQNVLLQTAPIIGTGGEISQVMEMATNITQIRRLQTHLSTLGLMVGTISHSIKGVLTGLDAGLYSLEAGLEKQNPDRVEEGVEVVKMMVDRIRKVVLNILYYARERELKWEKTDVRGFLTDTADMVSPMITGHNICLSVEIPESLGSFEVDPVMIRTALINILENAIEACIGDRSKDDHSILLSARREKDEITIEVRDEGAGMAPEQREKVFSLFFSSKGHTGTGMGLFISQRSIQQHGGSIAVESIEGKGTSFQVRLPALLSETAKAGMADLEQSVL